VLVDRVLRLVDVRDEVLDAALVVKLDGLALGALVDEPDREPGRSDSNGVGLNNVINRLNLYYGKENLLTIHSDGPALGTDVRIHIPK
jgi:LytS/YehU family sensor histidine kinase